MNLSSWLQKPPWSRRRRRQSIHDLQALQPLVLDLRDPIIDTFTDIPFLSPSTLFPPWFLTIRYLC